METIAVNNVAYTRAQLEEDYQIAVRRYAINPMTKRMESIAGLGVSVIEGTVTQASGSRLIVATSDGGHAALITVSSRSGKPSETPVAISARARPFDSGEEGDAAHSHSIVAGGLDEMSSTTRLIPRTSLMMRLEILASSSWGSDTQSAVIASSDSTTRIAQASS